MKISDNRKTKDVVYSVMFPLVSVWCAFMVRDKYPLLLPFCATLFVMLGQWLEDAYEGLVKTQDDYIEILERMK